MAGFNRCFKKLCARGLHACSIIIFAIGLILAGAPSFAAPAANGLSAGGICATSSPSHDANTQKGAPHSRHTHGDCCFLHQSAVAPPVTARAALMIEFPVVRLSAFRAKFIQLSPPDPGQSPQSPRAPPVPIA